MTDIDPRLLLTFREIAHKGSLSAAARDLGWTQPALGQQMRKLEQAAGTRLLERSSRGIELTAAGRVLLKHADVIAGRLTLAEYDLRAAMQESAGVVRLAAFPSACAAVVAPVMVGLTRGAQPVEVRLQQLEPPEATAALLAGEVDAAIVFRYDDVPEPELDPSLLSVSLGHDAMRAIVPEEHPLAERDVVDLSDLATSPWVSGCPRCRSHLLAAAARHGFRPDIRHSTDDYVVVQELVAAGGCVSLVPQFALDAHHRPGVRVLSIARELGRNVEYLMQRSSARTAVEALGETFRHHLQNRTAVAPTGPDPTQSSRLLKGTAVA
jgi:DNA-binding transcriptional LysR family regulator